MRNRGLFASAASVCLLGGACGGDSGTGPTTSHQIAGPWTYETRTLQDGAGTTCATTGTVVTFVQAGIGFTGTIDGGTLTCSNTGGTTSADLEHGQVSSGAIHGDSISFYVDGTTWRSVGTFVTPDSATGVVNVILVDGGTQYTLVGYWYSKRQ